MMTTGLIAELSKILLLFFIVYFAILFLLFIRLRIIRYRIFKGHFGNNRYEATQLVKFIQQKIDEDGSNLPGESVFSQSTIEEILTDWENERQAEGI